MKRFLLAVLAALSIGGLAWGTVESVTYISDLNASYPAAGDAKSEGDDHLRNVKTAIKNSFPNVAGAVTATHTQLSYVTGVTSAIQTQLNAKAATGAASASGLTMGTGKLLGRSTSGTGALEEITPGAGLSLSSGTLTGTGWRLLQTVTASSSATVDLETTFDSTYSAYAVVISGAMVDTNLASLKARMKVGGAYASSNYAYHSRAVSASSASYNANVSTSDTAILLTGSLPSASAMDMILFTHNPAGSQAKSLYFHGGLSPGVEYGGAGSNSSTSALTGIRILPSTGNIGTGTFSLYGLKS